MKTKWNTKVVIAAQRRRAKLTVEERRARRVTLRRATGIRIGETNAVKTFKKAQSS